MIKWIKNLLLRRKNKKLQEERYWKEYNEVLNTIAFDEAEAESIMWCRKHGWSDSGDEFIGKRPKLKIV